MFGRVPNANYVIFLLLLLLVPLSPLSPCLLLSLSACTLCVGFFLFLFVSCWSNNLYKHGVGKHCVAFCVRPLEAHLFIKQYTMGMSQILFLMHVLPFLSLFLRPIWSSKPGLFYSVLLFSTVMTIVSISPTHTRTPRREREKQRRNLRSQHLFI